MLSIANKDFSTMNSMHLQMAQLCLESVNALEKMSSLSDLRKQIERLDAQLTAPDLWNNPKKAASLMKERKSLAELSELIRQGKDDSQLYLEVLQSGETIGDQDYTQLFLLNAKLQETLFKQMMNDPVDDTPAIISISAGAGGLESANWVTMLLRMYVRYADSQGFKVDILDQKPSEEYSSICTDSVSIRIDGAYAYGFFKGESGVHRLIRNSPFNAADARQTSFAAIYVVPDIEDKIDIKIDEKDIEITAQAAGGPGGQNVNAVNSACRIKHFPTNTNIMVRTERDFHKNKATAIKMLKAKLYDIEMKKKQAEQDAKIDQQMNVSFGSQIRTTTLTPYSLVKDHRTGYETNNTESYLDGDVREFMLSYLQLKISS
jgi:peptide chain release factor 2